MTDRPLATQAAAPPVVPPHRPIVGAAMADDWVRLFGPEFQRAWDRRIARLQDLDRLLDEAIERNRVILASLRDRS